MWLEHTVYIYKTAYISEQINYVYGHRDKPGKVTRNHYENACMPWGTYTQQVKEESSQGADQIMFYDCQH